MEVEGSDLSVRKAPVSGAGKGWEGQLGGDTVGGSAKATWDLVAQNEPAVVAKAEKVEPRGRRGARGLSDCGVWGSWTSIRLAWLGGWS